MHGSDWTVVGEFRINCDSHDSELDRCECGAHNLRVPGISSVLVALDGPQGLQKLKAAMAADPRMPPWM